MHLPKAQSIIMLTILRFLTFNKAVPKSPTDTGWVTSFVDTRYLRRSCQISAHFSAIISHPISEVVIINMQNIVKSLFISN